MYVQIDYFYRHWWVNDTRVVQDGYRYNFDVDRTERINVYGMKTLFGVTGNLGTLTPKTPLTYPAYAGVG